MKRWVTTRPLPFLPYIDNSMKVIRFVTEAELHVYLAGGKLLNMTKHRKHDMKTTSIGFCFAELTDTRDADKWLRKLMFTRPCEYCIEFETEDFQESLVERTATYAADIDSDKWKSIEVREWSTTSYMLATHPYKRIGKCPSLFGLMQGEKIEWLQN